MYKIATGWYVVYTRPKQEKKVALRLSEQGVDIFLPIKKALHQWWDRKKTVISPLFPSYVFVYIRDNANYMKVLNDEGVCCFVKFGSVLARVSQKIIDNLKLIINTKEDFEVSFYNFQPGQQIVIKNGPLKGLDCEIVKHNDKRKYLVSFDLLNRNLLMSLPIEQLI